MDCIESRILIDECVHGSLDHEQAARLDDHLNGCAECAQDLKELTRVRDLLAGARELDPPAGLLDHVWDQVTAELDAPPDAPVIPRNRRMNAMPYVLEAGRAAPAAAARRRTLTLVAAGLTAAALVIVAYAIGMQTMSPRLTAMDAEAPGRQSAAGYAMPPAAGKLMYRDDAEEVTIAADPAAPHRQEALGRSRSSRESQQGQAGYMNQPPASESLDKAPGWATAGPQPAPPASRPSHVFTIDDQTRASSDLADAREGLEKQIKKLAETQRDQRELREDDTKAPQGAGENEAAKSQPKIIKSGELTVEVKDFAKASREADETIVKSGGYIADSRVQNLEGAAKRAIIKVRVVPEKFEALFAELKKLGNVLHERAGGQDVTAQYTDSEARIKNLQIAEERLQELIKTKTFMDKIQSLLEVERELTRVRGEIEGLQGQMRVWNDLLSLSTLTLTLQEPTRPVPGGNLAIEVRSLHESKAGLDAAVAKAGGQLLSGQVVKQGDGTLTGTYRLSVPFGGFASLAKEIKDLGRTEKEELQNQPFADRVPEGAERVPCYLNLYFFERGVQLPSGNLALEIETLDAAVQNLKAALVRHDGVAVSNQTFRRPDGGANANLTLQVKAGAFEKLVEELKLLGRVTQFSVGGESGDIRGGAAERPVQLAVVLSEKVKQIPSGEMSVEVGDFTETRTALSKLIADENLQVLASDSRQNSDGSWLGTFRLGIKADKMDSVVTKLEALGRVKNRNLKGLGLGDLSRVDPNVVGEVSVTFGEKPKLAPQEDGAFRLMLRDTFGGFLNSIGIIIRGLGWMVPWLAGLGLVYLLLRRATRTVPATPVAPAKPKESEGASTEDKKE